MINPFPWRVVDANLNRLREGLRVVEDILRYHWNSPLAKQFKILRHTTHLPSDWTRQLIESRNVEGDILRQEPEKGRREGVGEVLIANLKRGEESARVLEEIFKLLDPNWASTFKKIRYTLYQLEKEIILLGIEKEGKNFFGKKGENG